MAEADSLEKLRADFDTLSAEVRAFMTVAKPVIDGHQPPTVKISGPHVAPVDVKPK